MNSRRTLRHREVKALIPQLSSFKDFLNLEDKRLTVEVFKFSGFDILIFNGVPLLFTRGNLFVPTLLFEPYLSSLPQIIVDMGAVPHICDGADVMAPGVRNINGVFQEGSFVTIMDEKYRKTLAVGKALYNSDFMAKVSRGAVVETLHHVGDKVYRILARNHKRL
ncbi:MAG: DUF1947 domain-containing protein [Candidatus Bathyarchaeia archaeon]